MNKSSRLTKLNNRLTLVAALTVLFALCIVCAVSCEAITLVEITAEYKGGNVEVGGTISRDDIVVTAFFSDNSSKVVTDYELQYDFSAAGQRTVAIGYSRRKQGKTCTFSVNVVDSKTSLSRIEAAYNGGIIKIGGTLNKSDIVVTAFYGDETYKTVSGFTLGGFSSSTAGNKEVIVMYVEGNTTKTCIVTVTVAEDKQPQPVKTLESIGAVYNGKSIKVGAKLNNADIVVTARYSDGTSASVTNFTVGGFSSAKAGACIVTVSYAEGNLTKQCSLTLTIIERTVEVADYGDHGIRQQDGSIKITNTAIVNDDLQIHFISFENKKSGDCVYIKAGKTDVLIDAGSTDSSSATIQNYVNKYCTDGKLEYVVATHAHQDHIAGFVGTFSGTVDNKNGILDKYECGTIITYTNKVTTSALSSRFAEKCQAQKEKGANLYTALECYNNSQKGASRKFQLSPNVEMEILYNYYYDHTTTNENLYSVCLLINQYGEGYDHDNPDNPDNENYVNHYLFTGDLEADGESRLVDNNNLPKCVLYKSGHHGSRTSSTTKLLQVITPKVVCACSCAGDQYNFPHQEMLDRIAPFTQMFFMTNLHPGDSGSYALMNGNICVTSNEEGVFVNCSNNNTLFKDTDWFKENRDYPPEWREDTSN